jgi:hypothetical protein
MCGWYHQAEPASREKTPDPFSGSHQMPPARIVQVINQAVDHLPRSAYAEEASRLKSLFTPTRRSSRKEPESLGTLLVQVLAKRGIVPVESNESEAQDSD